MMSRCLKSDKGFVRSVHKHLPGCTHCCTLCRYGHGIILHDKKIVVCWVSDYMHVIKAHM